MVVRRVSNEPWGRKHELPRRLTAQEIAYPTSLDELIELCRDQPLERHLHAAGSHWGLSTAAESDFTFVETRDPTDRFPAMARTLTEVIPGCMSAEMLTLLANSHPTSFEENLRDGRPADDSPYYVHVESGKRIYELYSELDQDAAAVPSSLADVMARARSNESYQGPWAFRTLGAAGGQTVFGALTTGTHGGDFDAPPIADDVVAVHLVAEGGRHYWIEPPIDVDLTITDDDKLRRLYGERPGDGSPTEFTIIREPDVFKAVLVGAHRFGVVYSLVLRARRQYMMRETRVLGTWQDIRPHLAEADVENSWVYHSPETNKFLQIAVCLTPFNGFSSNLAGITKRSDVPWDSSAPPRGRAQRVGARQLHLDPLTGNPVFANAGASRPLDPDESDPTRTGAAGFLDRVCANGNFIQGVIDEVVEEIRNFVENPAVIGPTLGAVVAAAAGSGVALGLLGLLAALGLLLAALIALAKALSSDDDQRLGQTLNNVREVLLDQPAGPLRSAGLLTWQMIVFKTFAGMQGPIDHTGISYAIMDNHDYVDQSCQVNADSIEVFFDATSPMLPVYIDQLIIYERLQEWNGKAIVGYASLRFIGKSKTFLHPAQWERTCVVEVAGLRDVEGSKELIDYAIQLALDPRYGGILHWGQRNPTTAANIEEQFGDPSDPGTKLGAWKNALGAISPGEAFSSAFTRQAGLES